MVFMSTSGDFEVVKSGIIIWLTKELKFDENNDATLHESEILCYNNILSCQKTELTQFIFEHSSLKH